MDTSFLTPLLVKAARTLLEWQQIDLAKASGLSLSAINNFERNQGSARSNTLQAIHAAFEKHGIEFLLGGGLRRADDVNQIMRFSGQDFIAKWTEDIFASVRNYGDEILASSADEGQWFSPSIQKSNKKYVAWRERLGIIQKYLIAENHRVFNAPKQQYRVLPAPIIGKITYNIYADRIAFISWKKKQVVVMRNALVTETFRAQFNYLWKLAKPA